MLVTLTWRALTRDDVPAAAALTNAAAQADGTGMVTTEVLLAEELDSPRFEPATDSMGIWSGPTLLGIGSVDGRDTLVDSRAMVMLQGAIHPDHRGQGLGAALLRWLEGRGAAWAADRFPGEPIRLRSVGGLADSGAQRLLEQFGYTADNYFVTMEADLASWSDPGGATSAVVPDAALLEEMREAHNDAFRDHRNSSPVPAQDWAHWARSSVLRRQHSRVVVEDGRVLAYTLSMQDKPGTLHIGLVGTRREARGRGLAKEVLIASLRSAQQDGFAVSELEVDQTSPTGADQLYRSVGYRPVRVISRYIKDLPTG